MSYKLNLQKVAQLAAKMESKQVTVFSPDVSYYTGRSIMLDGKWIPESVRTAQDLVTDKPYPVKFGAVFNHDCCEPA